jgi:hypothetical protein
MKSSGSNRDRQAETRATLENRLREIEACLRGEACQISDDDLPKTWAELRRMNIPSAGIFPIGSPSTLNKRQTPHLRDVIDRAEALLKAVKSCKRRPKRQDLSVSAQCRLLRRQLRERQLTISGLAKGLHEAEMRIDLLERRNEVITKQLSAANKKIAELKGSAGSGHLRVVTGDEG